MKKKLLMIIFLMVGITTFYIWPTRDLGVEFISQYPNMPNGCEVTSLDMVVRYNGYEVSKEYLNDNFLKKMYKSSADPNRGYIGSPYKKSGLYCYAKPIEDCANDYFKSVSSSKVAEDTTGMGVFGILNKVVFKKQPVIVWYTIDDEKPRYSGGYYTDLEGRKQPLYENLHCMVVDGVSKGSLRVVDPLRGEREIGILKFKKLYDEMGKKSVVID